MLYTLSQDGLLQSRADYDITSSAPAMEGSIQTPSSLPSSQPAAIPWRNYMSMTYSILESFP
jgi:hypothetical protein